MKAAIVHAANQTPVYGDFAPPVAGDGEEIITVSASALSPLTRARAAGTHYSAAATFPFVAGVDGVGRRADGQRVYFLLPRAPFGGMAEQTVAAVDHSIALPDDIDDVTAAAIANPGMSSWAALTERAHFHPGETVLINGATGASGQMAVQIARHMGAGRIIVTGRNAERLAALKALGADTAIALTQDEAALEAAFRETFTQGVDIILDYLWGPSAQKMLIAAAKFGPAAVPLRFVQIGTSAAAEIALPGAVLRSSAIELMGSGLGSVAMPRLCAAIDGVMRAASAAGFRLDTHVAPLSDVAGQWAGDDAGRTVFRIG